jgi:hypothetical protein
VSFGAKWDAKSDELISSHGAYNEVSALRICMLLWMPEHTAGLPFISIPLEVIQRGAESTLAYIDNLKESAEIALRRKICLVGCGCAGKTSLVKSITSEKHQLAHVDDRTIGIDHFPLRFTRFWPLYSAERRLADLVRITSLATRACELQDHGLCRQHRAGHAHKCPSAPPEHTATIDSRVIRGATCSPSYSQQATTDSVLINLHDLQAHAQCIHPSQWIQYRGRGAASPTGLR